MTQSLRSFSCVIDECTVMSEALGVVGAWGIIVIEGVCVCCVCVGEGFVLVDWCFCVRAAMIFSCVAVLALSNNVGRGRVSWYCSW